MYKELLEFCQTQSQLATIEAVIKSGTQREAAEYLGVNKRTVERTIERIKKLAAVRGFAPDHDMTRSVPHGFKVKGTSTLYDDAGKARLQWVKTNQDDVERAELMRDIIESFKDDVPIFKPHITQSVSDNDLLNCYVITDYHLGMVAWQLQTGDEDWDTAKAEKFLIKWFETAMSRSPDASQCLFLQLGDFMHTDNEKGTTPGHGHVLDKDLPPKLLYRVAYSVMRKVIGMLQQKYNHVHVMNVSGNHDPVLSSALTESLDVHFSACDNVTIDTDSDIYHCYEFGDVSLFAHHGHKAKMESVSEVFAGQYREVFGRTKHSYAHLGHYHHNKLKENNLMTVEQHRTLSAKDAHAAQGGYDSGRDAKVITYDRNYGEVGRTVVSYQLVNSLRHL